MVSDWKNNIDKYKEMRKYRKMHRKHRKELIELAKKDREWDWGYLQDLVLAKIRHMHEYYTLGYNVWQTDETRTQIIESLQHVLDLQEKIDKIWLDEETCMNKWLIEQELYKEMYSYIGSEMTKWWD